LEEVVHHIDGDVAWLAGERGVSQRRSGRSGDEGEKPQERESKQPAHLAFVYERSSISDCGGTSGSVRNVTT
jgi:hypothetical protein